MCHPISLFIYFLKWYTSFLLHFSLLLCGTVIGMLILLNLLFQGGSVVFQVFQLSLNLCNMLHPGLPLCSICLVDAGGTDVRSIITHKNKY